jgi:hypothetical protein
MTQQYIVGQFSVLLEDLERASGDWRFAVHNLRRDVESAPPRLLPELAHEALRLTDTICWSALEQGDVKVWRGCANTAVVLGEFTDSARLLSR